MYVVIESTGKVRTREAAAGHLAAGAAKVLRVAHAHGRLGGEGLAYRPGAFVEDAPAVRVHVEGTQDDPLNQCGTP